MAETPIPNAQALARQARQHLDSLRAAGVEWLPFAPTESLQSISPVSNPSNVEDAVANTALAQGTVGGKSMMFDRAEDLQLGEEERRRELKVLAERVCKCTRCSGLAVTRTQTVFGVGKVGTEVCFIGEAPGADEDAQGEPFVGAAGQLLNRIIVACGMKREDVYICNILKCRPPGNRLPLADEAANCREYLDRQLELVEPKFICALGACAAQNLLGTTLSIGKLRGRFHEYRGIPVLCTYHPAYLLRSPDKKRDVWEDMKKLLERMGRPVPGGKH